MSTVKKIISGGQIGADIAGLQAGKHLGLETGGVAPKGWMTKLGSNYRILESYGLVECKLPGYPARTKLNVQLSDATVRFAVDFGAPGERCTFKAIQYYNKPYLDIIILGSGPFQVWKEPSYLREWLDENEVVVLNVAGNAIEEIEHVVCNYLIAALSNGR